MTLLVSRDAHQSVVAGLIFSGVQPRWIPPHWDADLHLTHAPSPAAVEDAWNQYSGAAGALAVSPTPYGTAADHTAIAEICLRPETRGWAPRWRATSYGWRARCGTDGVRRI